MTFDEFIAAELYELRHWSNDETLTFELSYYNRLQRAYNAAQQSATSQQQPTLRDMFAMSALQSLINKGFKANIEGLQHLTKASYTIADAMLKERSR